MLTPSRAPLGLQEEVQTSWSSVKGPALPSFPVCLPAAWAWSRGVCVDARGSTYLLSMLMPEPRGKSGCLLGPLRPQLRNFVTWGHRSRFAPTLGHWEVISAFPLLLLLCPSLSCFCYWIRTISPLPASTGLRFRLWTVLEGQRLLCCFVFFLLKTMYLFEQA